MQDTDRISRVESRALHRLSVEELESLLRTAKFPPDSEEEEAYYTAVEKALLEKEAAHPSGRLPDVDVSWQEFQQLYMSPEGKGLRLYGGTVDKPRRKRRIVPFLQTGFRRAMPVAAALAVVLSISALVQAGGINIYGALARWTKDTFSFASMQSVTEDYGFQEGSVSQELTDALDAQGIPTSFAPGWLPEEFDNYSVTTSIADVNSSVEFTIESSSGKAIVLRYMKFFDLSVMKKGVYEKNDCEVIKYFHNNQLFYLFDNLVGSTAAWSDGSYSISIYGDVPMGVLQQIIDSI